MTASIIDTTFTGKDISSAVSLYEYTAAALQTARFQVRFAAVAGGGDYVLYLALNDGDAQSDDPIEPRTTIHVPAAVTAFWSPTISIDLMPGDVVNVMAQGLAGDASESGSIRVFADNYSTHSAADVWAVSVRSLTTFGTLVADIWAYVTRTLTSSSGGATAQQVWEYARRTLTTPAHQVVSSMVGDNLTITNGVTFTDTISVSIPINWQKIYFTAKSNQHLGDSSSVLQIMVTNPPSVAEDGITYFGGSVGGNNRTLGSLLVDQPNGNLTIEVEDNVNFSSLVGKYDYDIKCLLNDGSSILLIPSAFVTIGLTPTKSIT